MTHMPFLAILAVNPPVLYCQDGGFELTHTINGAPRPISQPFLYGRKHYSMVHSPTGMFIDAQPIVLLF